jgi:hypothetical protein
MKHIVISAQMGAVSNLVKNIVLLSPDVDWPLSESRLDVVLRQYDPVLKHDRSTWTGLEVTLNQRLGNCFLMSFDWTTAKHHLNRNQPAAFINHSLFWDIPQDFDQQLNFLDVVFIMPSTAWGLEWQTRAAAEKVLIPNLEKQYDFCFAPEEKSARIADYIARHGEENYIKFNVHSMRHVLKQQQQDLRQAMAHRPVTVIALEDIILGSAELIAATLGQALNIHLDQDQVSTVLDRWRALHWAPEHTFDWPYAWSLAKDFPNE